MNQQVEHHHDLELYRLIVENTNDLVTVLGGDGTIYFESPSIENVLGYRPDELIGKSAYDYVHPDERAGLAQILVQRVEQQGVGERREYRFRHKDDSWRTLECVGRTHVDQRGEIVVVVNSRDITQRRRAEEETLLLQRVALGASAAQSVHETLEISLRLVCESVKWDYGEVWIPRPDRTCCDLAEAKYSSSPQLDAFRKVSEGLSFEPGVGLPGQAWELRQTIWATEIEANTEMRRCSVARDVGIRTAVSVPIFAGGEVISLMVLFSVEHRQRDDRMLSVLAGVAAQLGSIIQRKRAEEALRESETKYRLLMDEASDPIIVFDREGKIIEANSRVSEALNYSKEELKNLTVFDLIVPEDFQALPFQMAELSKGKTVRTERRVRRKDGSLIEVEISSKMFAGERVQAIVRDVTERKRADEHLAREKRFSDKILESIPGIFYFYDRAGHLLRWNRNFQRVSGYTDEEIARLHPLDFYADDEKQLLRERIEEAFSRGESSVEADFVSKNGTRTPYYFTGVKVVLDGEPYLVGVGIDVSELRRLEEQFRQSQKMEAIGTLAGGVAHDFNNLLTAIMGYCELLMMKMHEQDPARAQVAEIKRAGDRAANLTRQLLAFSRKQILQPKVVSLNEVVMGMEKFLPRLLGEDVELLILLEPACGQVRADPGQLDQVIMNLAVNARDAMPRGGKLTIETNHVSFDQDYVEKHAGSQSGDFVVLCVRDNGTGMSPETKEKIFEPFFTTKETGKGTGLGLSTVYGIVKQSGGWIWVGSEPGQGTTFKIYLPRVDHQLTELYTAQPENVIEKGTETILLVEDEEIVRQLAVEILELNGYEVLVARDGEEALRLCEKHAGKIDLMITDVVMPGMSGNELVQQVNQRCHHLRVIYMSGYTDDAIVRHGVLNEQTNFIQKPFTPAELTRKIREVLDGPEP